MAHSHTIHRHHFGWDNHFPAVARIAPGESLEFEVCDSSAGQLSAASTVLDVGRLDFSKSQSRDRPDFHRRRATG
jgi:acetamidase/formamidase